ncbi:MAG TPA: bifunctional 4-hydroxy-2-oxoglutarate aldolase/2-dehydro-3-deoxy-phosphogluconate aldolase [Gemmatimonadales bacterium]|jgi:2-dehydro-3-deoxyphosphogluconate aldolase/(4S)-4-hydroxy-2-oxoglutarate aldolase
MPQQDLAVQRDPPALRHILTSGVVAVVRMNRAASLRRAAEAVVAGGVGSFEVTLTTPGAIDAVRELAEAAIPGCLIGAGTVLDERTTNEVIDAGAQFVVSPTLEEEVIACCVERGVVCVPGAMTPTEILKAWRFGASLVKVYPSPSVGTDFFKNILAPLPFLRMIPSGGMTLQNAPEWIKAGAAAVSISNALMDPGLINRGAWAELTARARAFTGAVESARAELAAKGGQ